MSGTANRILPCYEDVIRMDRPNDGYKMSHGRLHLDEVDTRMTQGYPSCRPALYYRNMDERFTSPVLSKPPMRQSRPRLSAVPDRNSSGAPRDGVRPSSDRGGHPVRPRPRRESTFVSVTRTMPVRSSRTPPARRGRRAQPQHGLRKRRPSGFHRRIRRSGTASPVRQDAHRSVNLPAHLWYGAR